MTWSWSVPTTVIAGEEAIARAALATARLGQRALVVSDRGVRSSTLLVERWCSALAAAGVASTPVLVDEASLESVGQLVRVAGRRGVQVVVAVGGGMVMDTAKASALAARCPEAYLPGWEHGSGLVVPDPGRALRPLPTVACPTTVGTGSEVSPVACLTHAGRKKLVLHALLRPSVAVLDPAATAATPRRVVVEGALEILLRSLGPALGPVGTAGSAVGAGVAVGAVGAGVAVGAVGAGGAVVGPGGEAMGPGGEAGAHRRFADALALVVARGVLADGDRVARSRDDLGPAERAARHRLALASAQTHTGWGSIGRDPWGHKLWYLAHEVAGVAGVSKMSATAALLPAFLRLVAEGRWPEAGSPARLDRLVRQLSGPPRQAAPGPAAAASPRALRPGVVGGGAAGGGAAGGGAGGGGAAAGAAEALLARWGLPTCLDSLGVRPADVRRLARRTEEAWGPPLPALDGIGLEGITALYEAALTRPARPARPAPACPPTIAREEVNYA